MLARIALATVLTWVFYSTLATGQQQNQSTACLTTLAPNPPFVPPAPYFSLGPYSQFWYGTDALWTALPTAGRWPAFGKKEDGWVYRTKLVYWHRGFNWREETEPNLIVTGKRLDGDAPSVAVARANAVFIPSREGAGMMTLIDIPKAGCWEITAHYKGHASADKTSP